VINITFTAREKILIQFEQSFECPSIFTIIDLKLKMGGSKEFVWNQINIIISRLLIFQLFKLSKIFCKKSLDSRVIELFLRWEIKDLNSFDFFVFSFTFGGLRFKYLFYQLKSQRNDLGTKNQKNAYSVYPFSPQNLF